MNYISLIAQIIFWYIPFCYIVDFAFNIIQIPFALIHKYAVYIVVSVKVYLICQFFHSFLLLGKTEYYTSPYIMIAFCSLLLWYSLACGLKENRDSLFLALLPALSTPALIIIYIFNITHLNELIIIYFNIIKYILKIPVLGDILDFIFGAAAIWVFLLFAIALVILLTVSIIKFVKKIKKSSVDEVI